MSNDGLNHIIDSTLLDKRLNALISRRQREIIMESLTAGAKVLQQYTRDNLLRKMPKATSAPGSKKGRKMVDDIHIVKDKDFNLVMVSVLNYLTKWYEMGTDNRYLKETHKADDKHHRTYKKGEARGAIKPLRFFREARETHIDDVVNAITDKFLELLNKEFKETT